MIFVFTGHRDKLTNPDTLRALEAEYPYAVWMHGGAQGFDTQVHDVAVELGKQALPAFTSDILSRTTLVNANVVYTIRPAYGIAPNARMAPILRNEAMVNKMTAGDLLVACYDGRKGGGTFATVNYAERKGLTVRVVEAIAFD